MKKLLAFIALCGICIGIGYGYYYFSGDITILALVGIGLCFIAAVFILGLIFWLLEYIKKG